MKKRVLLIASQLMQNSKEKLLPLLMTNIFPILTKFIIRRQLLNLTLIDNELRIVY
jgi:hypothetical protein